MKFSFHQRIRLTLQVTPRFTVWHLNQAHKKPNWVIPKMQNKTFSRSDPDEQKLIKQSPNIVTPPPPSPHFHFQMSYCWSKSRRGNWAWLWSSPPLHKHRNGGTFDWFHLDPTSEDLFLSCLGSSFTVIQYLICHLYWWAVHVFDRMGGGGGIVERPPAYLRPL